MQLLFLSVAERSAAQAGWSLRCHTRFTWAGLGRGEVFMVREELAKFLMGSGGAPPHLGQQRWTGGGCLAQFCVHPFEE